MADITVRMIFNRKTGKKDIWIDFESDDDALPMEHEKRHREIVGQLLGQGVLTPDEMGEVIVQRGGDATPSTDASEDAGTQPEAVAEG